MATAALRLTGNIAFNRGNGTVVQMEQVGFPAHVITSGRLDSARLPANPQIFGNLTPVANLTYDLGSADFRWKNLWLSGAPIKAQVAVMNDRFTSFEARLAALESAAASA